MKVIGFVTHDNQGGAQRALRKLQLGFQENGQQFQLVHLYSKGNPDQSNSVALVRGVTGIWKYILVVVRLFKLLRASKPQAVISFLPLSNLLVGFCARLCGVNTIIVSHRNPLWTYNKLLFHLDRTFGAYLYTYIVANSEAVKNSAIGFPEKYKRKIKIIYNGLPDDKIAKGISSGVASVGESTPIIAAVGRLSEQKCYDFAMKIMTYIDNAQFVIAGHGEEENSLKTYAVKLGVMTRTVMLGRQNDDQIAGLLASSQIYLQTSRFEGQSNALLEALGVGCCIVSRDIPPQREVLTGKDGELCGLLIDSEDPKVWATEIRALMDSKHQRVLLAERALRRSKDFSMRDMTQKFIALCHHEAS